MHVITYIPDFQMILTKRCALACGYCPYPRTPTTLPPSRKQLTRFLRTAGRFGACQITLTAGEGIDHLPEIESTYRYYGYRSWYDYIRDLCATILQRNGRYLLFPQLDIGPIPRAEIPRFRPLVPVARLLLCAADDALLYRAAHRHAPAKALATRMSALEDLGRFDMATVTGIIVGIGESRTSWTDAARVVSQLNQRYGHIQSFVIAPFVPYRFAAMQDAPPPTDELVLDAIREVRAALDPKIVLGAELQERPHLVSRAVEAGATDLGRFVVGSSDRIDFEMPGILESLKNDAEKKDIRICQRMPFLAGFLRNAPVPAHMQFNAARMQRLNEKVFLPGEMLEA